ncbi:MAG: hypothetical protein ACLTAJ_08740 [Clostridium sp.]|uniref:hypothetical protein n=1 Tax=Clostridium sp. TaxID=1506 RepID=UPI0039967F8C
MANFNKSEEFEYIFKNLGKSDNKVEKLFDSMKDVYMVAFLLGAIRDEKTPIKKRSQDPIKDVYFSQDDKALMDLITLDLTKDVKRLNRSEENEKYIHDLVEEYCNTGIQELDEILEKDHFNLDNLINSIKKYENIPTPQKANIADLLFEINSKL